MQAGELKYKILVLKLVSQKNEFGSTDKEWVVMIDTRAKIIHTPGDKAVILNELYNNYKKTFIVRIYHTIDEKCRILYDGSLYLIVSIEKNEDPSQLYMTLITEKVNE